MPPTSASPEQGDRAAPALTVGAVARRLGVAPATLRTWDRRYGLGPSAHEPGAHRRYTEADLARLHTMRRLTLEGVAPADAARAAHGSPAPPARTGEDRAPGGPGGPVLAVPGASPALRGLSRAAMALDAPTMTGLMREELARSGTVGAWERLLRPALAAAGDRYAATGGGVDVEHLLSECVIGALHSVAAPTAPRNVRPVVLAGSAEELHALPLHALRAALAERGIAARLLGAATPPDALAAAVRRIGPAVVVVYSHLEPTARVEQLTSVPATRPPATVLAAGPGWDAVTLPPRVGRVDGLADAVARVDAALG